MTTFRVQVQYLVGLIIIVTFVGFIFCPSTILKQSQTMLFVQTVVRETIRGHLEGHFGGYPNQVVLSDEIQPGDIILCHNNGCGYGFWTHCAIFIGDSHAVDSEDFANGTRIVNIRKYYNYDKVAIFRGTVPDGVRKRIVNSAMREVGKPYDPFSSLSDTRSEYCSKLIWNIFSENGVTICKPKTWIIPDDIAKSVVMHMIVS